jgi:hypothetical protein
VRKCLLALCPLTLATASCSPALAHSLDASSDLDCAVLAAYFHDEAVDSGAPEEPIKGLLITNQWFAASLADHGPKPGENDVASVTKTIQSDPTNARNELKACMARATADPRFNKFTRLMGWRS